VGAGGWVFCVAPLRFFNENFRFRGLKNSASRAPARSDIFLSFSFFFLLSFSDRESEEGDLFLSLFSLLFFFFFSLFFLVLFLFLLSRESAFLSFLFLLFFSSSLLSSSLSLFPLFAFCLLEGEASESFFSFLSFSFFSCSLFFASLFGFLPGNRSEKK
jgi:hypothetical protein